MVAVAVLASFASPRLADRAERSSTRELTAGDVESARDQALWARVFNPLAVEPLLALARVAERQGRVLRAEREYIRAIELQPENPETWYTAGIFEFEVRDNMCAAYRYLNEAYTRDPVGNQWVDGGPLDVAKRRRQRGRLRPGLLTAASTASSVPGGASASGNSSKENQPSSLTSAGSTSAGSSLDEGGGVVRDVDDAGVGIVGVVRVRIHPRSDVVPDLDVESRLLEHLAHDGLGRMLAELAEAAGRAPQVAPRGMCSAAEQHVPVVARRSRWRTGHGLRQWLVPHSVQVTGGRDGSSAPHAEQ